MSFIRPNGRPQGLERRTRAGLWATGWARGSTARNAGQVAAFTTGVTKICRLLLEERPPSVGLVSNIVALPSVAGCRRNWENSSTSQRGGREGRLCGGASGASSRSSWPWGTGVSPQNATKFNFSQTLQGHAQNTMSLSWSAETLPSHRGETLLHRLSPKHHNGPRPPAQRRNVIRPR